MKFISEYREPSLIRKYIAEIQRISKRRWRIMEVCGGQTHAIMKSGLEELLVDQVELVHGPGCPVCVTPIEVIDQAVAIAMSDDTILCSFGDMLRVPGRQLDLQTARAKGADVRAVYSPLDALSVARDNPQKEVVFLAIGFETTAPANALVVTLAEQEGLKNFSILVSHVLVPPLLRAILDDSNHGINGLLAAGHVCAVMGYKDYEPIADKYKIPIVVTGFEPLDILQGVYLCIRQLEYGSSKVENQYTRVVLPHGNTKAVLLLKKIFQLVDNEWRGLGKVSTSGWALRPEYREYDARWRFINQLNCTNITDMIYKDIECISGLVLIGKKKPTDCPAFGNRCTPCTPLGATMVSDEGACAAYYRYKN
jgi:hydrogenase expression/formation protein HypD